MIQRLQEARERRDGGFTLIELLIVIVILGILAGVVVFSVRGLNDKGQTSACKEDTRTLQTAEEAYLARPGSQNQYTDETNLVTVGLLNNESAWHDISLGTGNASFTVTEADATCGTTGATAGTTGNF